MRTWCVMRKVTGVAAFVAATPVAATAQAEVPPDTVRRVAYAERVRAIAPDGVRLAVLDRTIALDLDNVPLPAALEVIAREAGLHLAYRDVRVPTNDLVSLRASSVTVEGAFLLALHGTHLDALVSTSGAVLLVPAGARLPERQQGGQQVAGHIEGRVIDATTGAALTQVSVTVVGTTLGATTRLDGAFRITGVPAGTYRLAARRLGYGLVVKAVTVAADSGAVVDFALVPSPAALEQVVTTVTGEQQRLALGNMIGTIRADSIVGVAPVTSLSDVISARVPGVQVFSEGGLTGASPTINIRGQNSLTVSNQPLLYVDGVRVENSSVGYPAGQGAAGFTSGRFNDLVPEEIESIEVVKGPSAATLYGTDAANGVILVTTKRGTAARPQWAFYGEQGMITFDRSRLLDTYYGWGHTTDGTNTPVQCTLLGIEAHTCAQDSVTHFNPAKVSGLTPVGTGGRAAYGLQLTGGGGQTRYFVSGGYEAETGYLHMPAVDLGLLRAERGAAGVSSDNVHPNAATKYSGRENLTTSLGSTADLTLDAGYVSSASRIPFPVTFSYANYGPGRRDANDGWFFLGRPANFFADRNDESNSHFTGGGASTWRPAGWLAARVTAGVDFSSSYYDALVRPGEDPATPTGFRGNTKDNVTLYSIDAGATASFDLAAALTSKTSVGVQYNRRQELLNSAQANQLAPGTETVAGGAVQTDMEATTTAVVAGGYVEQAIAFHNRLFVSGAVRADGGSTFGTDFKTAVYPKASVSWLISEEPFWPKVPGLNSVRLRSAYGASGVQPSSIASLPQEQLSPVFVDGQAATGTTVGSFGNLHLKPERQREFEGGADADLLGRRVHLEATYYDKRSSDALYNAALATSVGGGTQTINVGAVRNWGYEAVVGVDVIRSVPVDWTVQLNGSINHNQLVTLGPGYVPSYGFFGYAGVVPGYPLNAFFAMPIVRYSDANHDGVIEPTEVTVGATPVYIGQTYPKTQATLATTLGLFGERVQIATQVDYRGGFRLWNRVVSDMCSIGTCRGIVDPKAPLEE